MNGYEYNISLEVMFQALSSPVRVDIVRFLGAGPSCVNAIAGELSVAQSVVSQHLRVLRLAGLVEMKKHGKFAHYSIRHDAIDALREFLRSLCHCDCHSNSIEEKCKCDYRKPNKPIEGGKDV